MITPPCKDCIVLPMCKQLLIQKYEDLENTRFTELTELGKMRVLAFIFSGRCTLYYNYAIITKERLDKDLTVKPPLDEDRAKETFKYIGIFNNEDTV